MKLHRLLALCGAATATLASAGAPLVVCDFEDLPLGTTFTMWRGSQSTATVEADPANPSNKVLHIQLKEWGCHPEFDLPEGYTCRTLVERYPMVTYDFYRAPGDPDKWKQFAAFVGDIEMYRDEGYPEQGEEGKWNTRTYTFTGEPDDTPATKLRLGLHHNNTDYYIDNIKLSGPFDSYTTLTQGQVLDLCTDNSSSAYTTIGQDIYITTGVTAAVRGSRYTEWTGKVAGQGTLEIYAGGERFYIGTKASKGATAPDWSAFTGNAVIYPYKDVNGSCGFYGLLLNSGTFQPDNIPASRCNEVFARSSVTLAQGAVLAAESGTRGMRLGSLDTQPGSRLDSYYKSGTAKTYYVIGHLGTDCTIAGTVSPSGSGNSVGIVKEGQGCLTISGTANNINGGIRINDGTLAIDCDTEAVAAAKSSGPTGNAGFIYIGTPATLCGNGALGSAADCYGTVSPGSAKGATLTLADYTSAARAVNLTLHPEAKVVAKASATGATALDIKGQLIYSNLTAGSQESDRRPRLFISLVGDGDGLTVGQEFTFVTATTVSEGFAFDIRYPKRYTWEVTQGTDPDGRYTLTARVTSLDYSGQGDTTDDDDPTQGGATRYPANDWRSEVAWGDTPLRDYATALGKSIGVALSTYRYDLSASTGAAPLAGREFNLAVAENEMKFDATHPSQDEYTFGGADAVAGISAGYKQELRGHTLAWHQQVPAWVSSDGRKNSSGYTRRQLLDILKEHITTVMGRYKGKVREWDVCNEVLDDDQSCVRTDPSAYTLRPSIWATYIGEEFIDSAFVWARKADPQAKLYINDYGVEHAGTAKSDAYFNLLKRLVASGVPVDGCGLQCHLSTGELDTARLERNIQRYAPLGLDCIITELDIAVKNVSALDGPQVQADEYAAITRIWLRNDNCPSLLVWGISDNNSWRENQPLLFDSSLAPKPAYWAVHSELRRALEADQGRTGIDAPGLPAAAATPVRVSYYDTLGRVLARPAGLVVERTLWSDGHTSSVKKVMKP